MGWGPIFSKNGKNEVVPGTNRGGWCPIFSKIGKLKVVLGTKGWWYQKKISDPENQS